MSLKSIEMQIAIPRTNEIGAVQNQLSHKPMHDQALLAENALRNTEEQRHRSTKVDQTSEMQIKEEKPRDGQPQHKRGAHPNAAKEVEERIEHPYKGHNIDLSL